jgi:hypothetical protein
MYKEGMRRPITLNGYVIVKVNNFKYFGSFIQKDGGSGMDVEHRIKCGWMK